MSLEKRLEYLEKLIEPNGNIQLQYFRVLFSFEDTEAIDKHIETAEQYLNTHPEIWASTESKGNMKLLRFLIDNKSWTPLDKEPEWCE